MNRPTVLLGMSGGVDSSVAAAILLRQGYQVQGVTIQIWEPEGPEQAVSKKWQERGCCKIGIAKYVAQKLNIPYEVIDAREYFRENVIADFIKSYKEGTTPNPCVRCNERVKIRRLIELADLRGIEYVATGHYARVEKTDAGFLLQRSVDVKKDQSYFLYRLHSAWLPRLLFPVGGMCKSEVWAEAEALGLPAEELKESQEICFVSQGDYRSFLEREDPTTRRPGAFLDQAGQYLGQHDGIAFYTPGQRRGLGIAVGRRLYVQQVHPTTNTVILGPEDSLYQEGCEIDGLNLFDSSLTQRTTRVEVKIRYATPAIPATLHPRDDGSSLYVRFHEPQRAVCPGQSAVFYRGEYVLGGGIIRATSAR
ncbi:MAG: tRNA 2-thiouridine(34) synthase MnmA [Nitrospira sp.]|nr:tRNA 2-thiouridine(34) synthase MnmA [Nitrospira sp.]MCP9465551.1 tRNA 2-thiouridine(34) synthase MnmA [Nitrospira sp.]